MNNNIKSLCIFDIDGVILTDKDSESKLICEGIRDLNRRKISYTFCTGRSYYRALSVIENIGVDMPIIIENGSKIIDTSGNLLKESVLTSERINTVIKKIDSVDINFATFSTSYNFLSCFYVPHPEKYRDFLLSNKQFILDVTDDLGLFKCWAKKYKCTQITVNMNGIMSELGTNNISDNSFVSYTNEFISKGNAIIDLAKTLNIPLKKIAVVGNDVNDISMFKQSVAIKVAVINTQTPEELIKLATHKVRANGLPNLINKLWGEIYG